MCWCVPPQPPNYSQMCPPCGLSWDGFETMSFFPLSFSLENSKYLLWLSGVPLFVPSHLVGWSFDPWPKVAPCLSWLGRCLGGMVKGWAKFISLPSKFFCSFHISLSLSTNHLAASSSLLPDHGMPPLDLLPPSAALFGEATWY